MGFIGFVGMEVGMEVGMGAGMDVGMEVDMGKIGEVCCGGVLRSYVSDGSF